MTEAQTAGTVEVPARKLGLVKAVGVLGIIGGLALIAVGLVVWNMASVQLRAEDIVIPDDANASQGPVVQGPFTAFVQADTIQMHALHLSGGKTYAELPQDDPIRDVMMNASFLRASLFTSVVSYGVAVFAMGVGALFIIFGWAVRRLASAPVIVKQSTFASGGAAA